MSGDVRHFRRKFFGGFDSHDVMRYIEELAAQRNKYKLTGDKLEVELKDLEAEIKKLQNELDESDRRIKNTLEEASSSLATLRDTYSDIQSEMETTTHTISSELAKMNSTLTVLSNIIDKTGSSFAELQAKGHDQSALTCSTVARFDI